MVVSWEVGSGEVRVKSPERAARRCGYLRFSHSELSMCSSVEWDVTADSGGDGSCAWLNFEAESERSM